MRRCFVLCVLALVGACAASPRYIVTGEPLKVIDPAHPGLCIAIDSANPRGVWWWDAGRTGCSDRSSSTMGADRASVARTAGDAIDASFQVGLMSGRTLEVRLEARDGRIRDAATGTSVRALRRATQEVPERLAGGR